MSHQYQLAVQKLGQDGAKELIRSLNFKSMNQLQDALARTELAIVHMDDKPEEAIQLMEFIKAQIVREMNIRREVALATHSEPK